MSAVKEKKYIFVNGVMKLNPNYGSGTAGGGAVAPQTTSAPGSLAVVTCATDIIQADEAQMAATGKHGKVSDSTAATLEMISDESYSEGFESTTAIDAGEIVDKLGEIFTKYEVPIGLLNKLLVLMMYRLYFIIDDSGSMNEDTDVNMKEAHAALKQGETFPPSQKMTRWQEAENRIHILMDIIAYIPTKGIKIVFLNDDEADINLNQHGKTPEQFKVEAHIIIHDTFNKVEVRYKTPTFTALMKGFQEAATFPDPTIHYLFTDGMPTDKPTEEVARLIMERPFPDKNPLILMTCTDEDDEAQWMKEVEEAAPFCSELDDFKAEQREVQDDQGTAFPFTKGFWLVCQLCAACYPDDLDAIDESLPFSKYTLDNLLGRTHTDEEYRYYFERNPHASLYISEFKRLRDEQAFSRAIIPLALQQDKERRAGYRNGQRPESRTLPNIAPLLDAELGVATGKSGGKEVEKTKARSIFNFGKR